MPHPTIGIVGLGMEDWRGVELKKVVEDIYIECSSSKSSGNAVVWVRFENPQTDKYGNVTMAYDDYQLATIPLSEARKYKSSKFLDAEYKLSEGIRNAAFRANSTVEEIYTPNQYIAPTDTINLDYYY